MRVVVGRGGRRSGPSQRLLASRCRAAAAARGAAVARASCRRARARARRWSGGRRTARRPTAARRRRRSRRRRRRRRRGGGGGEAGGGGSSSAAAADDAEPALAPRGAKYRLEDVREAFKLSLAQFAQLLSTVQPVSQKLVQSWEAGLARVPMRILKRTEELSEQLAAEAAKAQPPPMEVVDLKAEYPYQEPMIGPDYQASVPRSCSAARNRREDEKVWCPKSAAKESVKVDAYLARVREALRGADGLQPSAACVEESALQVLHTLKYDAKAALAALELCVAWRAADAKKVLSLPTAAAVNAMLWLHRLDGEARKARWGAGEKEAMDAALLEHGKDPVVVADNAFREKPRGEVVRMYFECDAWRRYQAAQAANAPPEPDPPEKKSKKQKT